MRETCEKTYCEEAYKKELDELLITAEKTELCLIQREIAVYASTPAPALAPTPTPTPEPTPAPAPTETAIVAYKTNPYSMGSSMYNRWEYENNIKPFKPKRKFSEEIKIVMYYLLRFVCCPFEYIKYHYSTTTDTQHIALSPSSQHMPTETTEATTTTFPTGLTEDAVDTTGTHESLEDTRTFEQRYGQTPTPPLIIRATKYIGAAIGVTATVGGVIKFGTWIYWKMHARKVWNVMVDIGVQDLYSNTNLREFTIVQNEQGCAGLCYRGTYQYGRHGVMGRNSVVLPHPTNQKGLNKRDGN